MADLDTYRDAISSIESSNRYDLLGPVTASGDRAYGRYQVMGTNIGPWSQAALGRTYSPGEFLNDQSAQDAVFNHRFGGYLTKYGNPDDAAAAWFTGRPLAQGAGARDVLGTSGSEYVRRFRAAAGLSGDTPIAASMREAVPGASIQTPNTAPDSSRLGELLLALGKTPQNSPQPNIPVRKPDLGLILADQHAPLVLRS